MKICPDCQTVFDKNTDRFCPNDGEELDDVGRGTLLADRYEIVDRLGSGGMGVVYLANHVTMKHPVAVKLVRTDALGETKAAERLLREARTAVAIDHPNVVHILDAGEIPGDMAYIVMEYVDGETLADRLEVVRSLTPRLTARIVWQVADALASAHRHHVVHRDIKPANIMLAHNDAGREIVKVVDFGIAKPYDAGATSTLTRSGHIIGTPAYMSPEQFLGVQRVDHRSDIYSLGLVAVQMLGGGVPDTFSRLPSSGREILDGLPGTADWHDDVKSVLAQCLDPDPDGRFDDALEFASKFVGAVEVSTPRQDYEREPWDTRLSDSVIRSISSSMSLDPEVESPGPRSRRMRSAAIVGVATIGVASVLWGLGKRPQGDASVDPAAPDVVAAPVTASPPAAAVARVDSSRRGDATELDARRSGEALGPPTVDLNGEAAPVTDLAVDRLRRLVDLDAPNVDSTREAVALAGDLLDLNLPEVTRIEVIYRRAEANLVLGDSDAACEELRGVLSAAETVGEFGRAVRNLLESSCGGG